MIKLVTPTPDYYNPQNFENSSDAIRELNARLSRLEDAHNHRLEALTRLLEGLQTLNQAVQAHKQVLDTHAGAIDELQDSFIAHIEADEYYGESGRGYLINEEG